MEHTEAYQRVPHPYDDLDDDISYSSGDDNDSDYGADNEDNDDYPDETYVAKDPGAFRYNRKLFMVSLPCALMVLSLVGEILLMTVSFGTGLIIILDPKGEKKRCTILFTLLFVFCHMFIIYSVLPLLCFGIILMGKRELVALLSLSSWCLVMVVWLFLAVPWVCLRLSVFNLFLIGIINMYVILTGGLCIIQFSHFRKFELKLSILLEQLLFSLYPGTCIILLTWATSSVVPWEVLPYILLAYGFIYLQIFMIPHTSSFKTEKTDEDNDLNIIPETLSLLMAIVYCMSPSMLYVGLHFINRSFISLWTGSVMVQLVFILSLSVFLTTLMSLRNICEYAGWPHKFVVYARWGSGSICTVLLYPVLVHYGLSSHFLPWLPAGVALYAVYGALLSEKRFRVVSLLCLPAPILLFTYWLSWLPWKIVVEMLFSVQITRLYIFLLVNCLLCFTCVYSASHGHQSLFELLLITESLVFTGCEILLYSKSLYPKSFLIITAAVILYTLHRLNISSKVSNNTTTICSAVHFTKALVVVIYHYIGTHDQLTMYRCVTLLFMSLVLIRVISLDTRVELMVKDVVYNFVAMSVAIVINANTLLHMLCIYILWEEPTSTDIMGLCIMMCGVSIFVLASLHLAAESVTAVRQIGIVAVSLGVLVLILQPAITLTWSGLLQWGDLGSVVLAAFLLLSNKISTIQHVFISTAVLGVCPGIRMSTLLYSYEDSYPFWLLIGRCILYIQAVIALAAMLLIFVKLEVTGKTLDRYILKLCGTLAAISVLLLMVDLGQRDKNEALMSLPAWKLLLVTAMVVSISLKILSTTQDLLIPLVEDKKEKDIPLLPLVGNITSILAFLLACIQCPFSGYLQDIWFCGASLILICFQKDKRLFTNIKQENQIVPTIFTCITVLYITSILRSDLWTSGSWSFLRSLLEITCMLSVLPLFYIMWGILWEDKLIMSEKFVVFLLPLNAVYLLYGSSYTSQTLALIGLFSGIWMMVTRLPLIPYVKKNYR